MTQPVSEIDSVPPESKEPPSDGEAAPPPAPEPEPWTPERVSEWNAYYDRYVMGAALLLALVVSCNYVADSSVFLHLKTGQLIGERMAPLMDDQFSYTQAGKRWVDVPWLFQWSHGALYNLIYGAVPVDPNDQTANQAKAERIAIGSLGLLDALARLATAWILLKIRHRGPGLWWTAICVVLAVGVFYDPVNGIAPGGLASVRGIGPIGVPPSAITPATWGYLFLAFELLIVFRAFAQGRPAWAWWLIPLFVLWANWDVSFLTGLLVLAGIVAGHWLDGGAPSLEVVEEKGAEGEDAEASDAATRLVPRPIPVSRAFLILGLCAVACLANPWTYGAYIAAVDPFIRLFQPIENFQIVETLSFFSSATRQQLRGNEQVWTWMAAFYLIMVAVGLASFLLNAARFSWRRFLPFAVVSVLWACLMRYSAEFALVFAAVIALNGQEWYQGRFGTRGRLGARWTVWSTGGRLVTLALIFAAVGIDITGWHVIKPGVHFGLGYNPDHFPLEAADFLVRQGEIRGNVLNTSMGQGNVLIWKAFPLRKTYVDGRTNLFSQAFLYQWDLLRHALRDDKVEEWKPILDQHNISAVMIEPVDSSKTYLNLRQSPNWIPFYDDGRIVMFGRKDAPATDLAVFNAHRLEPSRVYRTTNPLPPSEGPPTATSWIDQVFENRSLDRAQMRTQSAWRWLTTGAIPGVPSLPEPARCLLAIQDARIALSRNPDDPMAFRILNEAYRVLTLQETALLAGIPLTPENYARIAAIAPSPDRLMNRYRQRVTALNYAIQTSPTPVTAEGRDELFELNYQLFELYAMANAADLARDQLAAALAVNPTDEYLKQRNLARPALQAQVDQLNDAINQIDSRMSDLEIEQQARPVDLANFARQQGGIGLAIKKLESAETSGDPVAVVKPQLLDLYCNTGQPDKALDLLNVGSIGDPNLGSEPGVATYRQGLVYYLLGNYLSTASLWNERSIPQVRLMRSGRALDAAKALVHGQAVAAVDQFLGIPGSLDQQASWEFDLAICQLEAGLPDEAARHFTAALTLEPDLSMRPIAAYYLEQMGKPVPPKREARGKAKAIPGDVKASGAAEILEKASVGGTPVPATPRDQASPSNTKPAAPRTETDPSPAPKPEPAKGTQPATKTESAKAVSP